MYTFVRLKDSNVWLWEVTPHTEGNLIPADVFIQRQTKNLFGQFMTTPKGLASDVSYRRKLIATVPNYPEMAKDSGETIYVRAVGSYTTVHPSQIAERVFAMDFPTGKADICICENDETPEPFWLSFLQSKYPDKTIKTINNFSSRTVESLQEEFKGVKILTFSTTFTNFRWYETAIKIAKLKGIPVVGYSHDEAAWEKAKNIAASNDVSLTIVRKDDIRQFTT
jgi:hypothetical protein